MDLNSAIAMLGRTVTVISESDKSLLAEIAAAPGFKAPTKALSSVQSLGGGLTLQPADALLGLAYATRMHHVHPDIYELYRLWSWMRYLGVFDVDGNDSLILSNEARQIRGNQRRVLSEELGIGFAKVAAERWMAAELGFGTVTLVDVDVVPDGGVLPVAGAHLATKISTRRPDYFLVHLDGSGVSRVRVLECKGTLDPGNQVPQLAKAVRQLEGIAIDGAMPVGLAVSAALPDDGPVRLRSVDPHDDEFKFNVRLPPQSPAAVRGDAPVDAQEAVRGVVEAGWAHVADFAGSTEVAAYWAPAQLRGRFLERPADATRVETPVGICVGRQLAFQSGNQRVSVFCGVIDVLHDALASGDRDRVLDAQGYVADVSQSSRDGALSEVRDHAVAVGADGTVLELRILG
ncbi:MULTISPECIES: hypothetical protein [unclassified Nocardioides]|uniref:hypothetical protein n=1 Tax=unclassified Nocardioides TaxID=2615069 RepID=UPI0007034F43|nr:MULTISPECIES: hypothetical protein [unclassified Nocardioides]KRC58867.1 hypothetical protein ASE19_22645 [Nocardioides sp. Root79]KRC76810.1 hypothetical protein ASE20_00695 [Nocardioides sp. Root240]